MDATNQECDEISKVSSLRLLMVKFEILINLPPNNFFQTKIASVVAYIILPSGLDWQGHVTGSCKALITGESHEGAVHSKRETLLPFHR